MPNPDTTTPVLDIKDGSLVAASGDWQVHALTQPGVIKALQAKLGTLSRQTDPLRWDLSDIGRLDHIGAQLLWNAWGKTRPKQLTVAPQHRDFFQRLASAGTLALPPKPPRRRVFNAIYDMGNAALNHVTGFITLLGQLLLDFLRMVQVPQRAPWKEISANVYHVGYQALGITALVGFLIGVVLSFLSAQQLHTFGGDIYLVNILGMSIIRELGPLLAAILVAGRSGSAITAQLGVMRVTEELDAMLVMGLPHGFRLVLPRVLALLVAMPLLVIWTDAVALLGGMTAAQLQLGLSPTYFLQQLPNAVPLPNYLIGLGKGAVFGGLIAMVACYFGLRVEPNTESLGHGTTASVVTAITIVIVADAVFAIIFRSVGF
ncbi:phospholipid/cholesterol/gamma-HCH transport system permease protein [Collimonas sp. OK242]|jgi:phospholipid/cholesterol/gamma-HCH transport system permease protein|uniref:MlaE family ABC transporter permease n=1 Tax=Collimonas sp. OK242 TaxID=1798195 RepID=UPI00089D2316|nr:ABC transporter permease [Collimonas sp. OK242]SDX81127.1 phospholipid/cholesterol/gamma-HCH transport system permease protein [Collimonas sp. OK242]